MSYKKDTIEIKLNSYGTLDVVCVPVKLYKDSYKVVKLRVLAPDKSGAVVKVYSTGRNVAGEQVWTSETYSVPSTQETKTFGDATYRVYETMLPQEFCLESGDLNLTFAQVVTTSGAEEIITSGTLNQYVSGEGFNYAGVKISDYDVLAGKVNEVIENAVNREDIAELEDKIVNSASKDELNALSDKVDGIEVPTKLSELDDDVNYAKTLETNIFQAEQKFYRGVHIRMGSGFPFVEIGKSKITPTGKDYDVALIKHASTDGKEHTLALPDKSGTIALTKDIPNGFDIDKLNEAIVDSDTIVHSINEDKVQFSLDAEVQNKIAKSLVTPMSRPSATELVAVDSTNSQRMLNIGDGLELDGDTLKATGGGGSSVTVVDTLVSQSTTDALSARQGNVLYNMVVDAGTNAHKQILIGGNGVLQGNVYNFTIQDATAYISYRTNLTKFLVDLNLAIVGDLDKTKEVAITFGNTTYYLFNILKGNEHATIGDLQQVDKYNNATGYRFITEMTFVETSDLVGFAVIPTISMSDILALDSDQMDNYVADGGLSQGQLAVCNKVITNGYEVGALYRFDIVYPSTYSWTQIGYSKSGIDNAIKTAIQDTWGASY